MLAAPKDLGYVEIGRLRRKLPAIVRGNGPEYVLPDEGRPICKPYELNLDVLCRTPIRHAWRAARKAYSWATTFTSPSPARG